MHTRIHESVSFREASGPTLRPGGLELTDRAMELCRFHPGAELLDVGCGSGVTVGHLRDRHGCRARGVDISARLIAEGRERDPALQLMQAPAEALPMADETLDGIFCECVLSLLEEPVRALREFHRALRPGGRLVLSDLYLRRVSPEAREENNEQRQRSGIATSQEVQRWLREAGFDGFVLWEDHTRKLTELAARVMLAHGNLECLATLCGGEKGKPGYYLLVTSKGEIQGSGTGDREAGTRNDMEKGRAWTRP